MSASASNEECVICLETLTKCRPVTVIICSYNHKFHKKCIRKWQNGSKCAVCMATLSQDASRSARKKRQSDKASTSEEPESSQLDATPGGSKRKETSETSLRRSTRIKANSCGGTKGTYEEEELKYAPDWDVFTTDHISDPLVAQNLAEGLILPTQAVEMAEMPRNLQRMVITHHLIRALNYHTEYSRECKCTELSETVQALREQLASADARATAAEARAAAAEARAAASDARTADADANARAAVEKFKASEEYRNALKEYALASFKKCILS